MNRRDAIKQTSLLLGYTLSASAVSAVLSGCRAEPKAPDWAPSFFTETEMPGIEAIAEAILPKTDTYGANDVGVPQFIDLVLNECYTADEQQAVKTQLAAFEADCQDSHQMAFAKLNNEQQIEQLHKWEEQAKAELAVEGRSKEAPKPFFTIMKELCLLGYMSSEKVGKELLVYDPIPGQYDGCISFDKGGVKWTL